MRRFFPLPLEPEQTVTSPLLDITVKIETPTGWIDLSDDIGYQLHAECFADRSVTQRKLETQGNWVEGTFTSSAVRDDVVESLAVYVLGETRADHLRLLEQLEDAVSQIRYRMLVRIEEVSTFWDCEPADYSINTQREFLHARRAVFRAQVPRKPAVEAVLASGDEL